MILPFFFFFKYVLLIFFLCFSHSSSLVLSSGEKLGGRSVPLSWVQLWDLEQIPFHLLILHLLSILEGSFLSNIGFLEWLSL